MIVVQLCGGLGNQMFQYATAKHLAKLNNSELKIDTASFAADKLRDYSLGVFKISASSASEEECNKLRFGTCNQTITKVINHFRKISKRLCGKSFPRASSLVEEISYSYDPEILKRRGNLYLQGYWQTEKYFQPIRSLILAEFSINAAPDSNNLNLLAEIAESNSVSLHVRRSDYVNDAKTQSVYVNCSIDYYKKAVEIIKTRVAAPRFFIFSDDPDWAEKNLDFGNCRVVRGNDGDKSVEDLRLMAHCRHNIIANSSFSWWGAWLNTNADKIVIGPAVWFKEKKFESSDRMPDAWIKI
ncbi:MAG: alpha-1,2-fucosyltransferase [Candidatus Riflebacteria bacterium]